MLVEIALDDDEDIIRAYKRWPKKAKVLPQQSDFQRVMAKGNGISIWRLKLCSRQDAMDAYGVAPEMLKGTVIIKAKLLKDLGMRFAGQSQTTAHIAARCVGCDMNMSRDVRCKPIDNTGECGLSADAVMSLRLVGSRAAKKYSKLETLCASASMGL